MLPILILRPEEVLHALIGVEQLSPRITEHHTFIGRFEDVLYHIALFLDKSFSSSRLMIQLLSRIDCRNRSSFTCWARKASSN